ncbi:Odorant receptor 78, partial [Frankliniella occidentalis]
MAVETPDPWPLAGQLQWWLRLLGDHHAGLHQRALAWGRGTPSSLVVTVAGTGLFLVDAVLSKSFGSRTMFAIRMTIGVYSCVFSQLVFMRRQADLCDILHNLGRLAADLEPRADRDSQGRMRGSAVLSARLVRFFYVYGCTSLLLVSIMFVCVKPLWIKEIAGAATRLVANSSGMAFVCINSFYCLILCMLFIYAACADLCEAVGRGIEVERCSRSWPTLLRGVLDVLLRMDNAFADMMPHLLVVSVVLPLLSTVEVFARGTKADVFALLMAPVILAVFVPICVAGENLAAARRGLSVRAYRGPWLE